MHQPPNRLRELREAQGLKAYDLAHRLRVSEGMVARYERGQSAMPDDRKRALAAIFGVSVEYLMGWDWEAA